MTRIRRLYDKDQEVIFSTRLQSLSRFLLDCQELVNLEIGKYMVIFLSCIMLETRAQGVEVSQACNKNSWKNYLWSYVTGHINQTYTIGFLQECSHPCLYSGPPSCSCTPPASGCYLWQVQVPSTPTFDSQQSSQVHILHMYTCTYTCTHVHMCM